MDVELLIAKVYERLPVWNKWKKHPANRNVVDRLWVEISHELNCEGKQIFIIFIIIVNVINNSSLLQFISCTALLVLLTFV